MHKIWCGRAIGAPIRSPGEGRDLPGGRPLGHHRADPVQATGAEEPLVEVVDDVGQVDIMVEPVIIIDPGHRDLGARGADAQQEHEP